MNRRMLVRVLIAGLSVLWLFVVGSSYFVVHKPFGIVNALALLSVAADLFVLALLLLLASALGRRLTHRFEFDSPVESLVLSAGLGWGAISFSIFVLGIVGLLYPVVYWALAIVGIVLLHRDLRDVFSHFSAIRLRPVSRFEKALAIFISATLAFALVRALTPPIAWDAQVYHLTEGKFWIAQGRITSPPDIPYFSFPSLMETIYLGALLLRGDTLAQVIHWSYLLLCVVLVLEFARRYFSSRVAWLAAAILVAVPSFVLIASWPYVDAALAFYATAALYCLLRATAAQVEAGLSPNSVARAVLRDQGWYILGGVFAGLSLGIKYTALIVPLAGLVLILVRGVNRTQIMRAMSFIIPAVVLAAPWYLRNALNMGNPIYPFLAGGRMWDSFRAWQFSRFGSGLVQQPWRLVLAPWEATISGQEGGLGYEATIGPLLLIFLPFLALTSDRKNRVLHKLLIFGAILYAFWLFGIASSKLLWQTRLLFPAFPVFAIAAAVGFSALEEMDLSGFSLYRFGKLVTLCVIGFTLIGQTLDLASLNPIPFLTGFESRDQYLSRNLAPEGYYAAMQRLGRLPSSAKVLFLWEPRSYYAAGPAQVVPDALLDRFGDLNFMYGSPSRIASALRAEGYTHILLSRSGLNYYLTTQYDPISQSDAARLEEMLAVNFRLVAGDPASGLASAGSIANSDSKAYELYQIIDPGVER